MTVVRNGVGVLIARFQVDDLHKGHVEILQNVCAIHRRVVVLLGVPVIPTTETDPLDYPLREAMVRQALEVHGLTGTSVTITPLLDLHDNAAWSSQVDVLLRGLFPLDEITLYGGRDSCLSRYQGRLATVETTSEGGVSGTDVRRVIGISPRHTADFRAGVIYATQNQFRR